MLVKSKCPDCRGEDPECEICNCTCRVGPIKFKHFEEVSRAAQGEQGGEEDTAPTVEDQQQVLLDLLSTAVRNGKTDLRQNNVDETRDNVAGAGAAYISNAEPSVDQRHAISEMIGRPTTNLGGTSVEQLQQHQRIVGITETNSAKSAIAVLLLLVVVVVVVKEEEVSRATHRLRPSLLSSSSSGQCGGRLHHLLRVKICLYTECLVVLTRKGLSCNKMDPQGRSVKGRIIC